MTFMNPIIHLFVTVKDYDKYTHILEDRNNIEKLITAIEEREDEKIRRKKEKPNEKRGHNIDNGH